MNRSRGTQCRGFLLQMLYFLLSKHISFPLLGTILNFIYYTLIYAVIGNILLYLFLKRCFNRIYLKKNEKRRGGGTVAAFYLIGYGIMRFSLEMIRKEKIIAFGLTQAQVVMILFIMAGGLILYGTKRSRNA
ncbi:MAG: prolipoprotein diacylglyceryl transferase [Deltaproteobacteria bacterium]|nr:prolipoprotein diacylglyceryl transferase [Deltaproteobacteria bacterium]